MGYENDWALFIGYRGADLEVEPPGHWDRLEHVVVDVRDVLHGALLYRSEPGSPPDGATGPFTPRLVERIHKRIRKEAHHVGIRAEPRLYAVHNRI